MTYNERCSKKNFEYENCQNGNHSGKNLKTLKSTFGFERGEEEREASAAMQKKRTHCGSDCRRGRLRRRRKWNFIIDMASTSYVLGKQTCKESTHYPETDHQCLHCTTINPPMKAALPNDITPEKRRTE